MAPNASHLNTYREQRIRRLRAILADHENFVNTKLPQRSQSGKYSFFLGELCSNLSKQLETSISKLDQEAKIVNNESSSKLLDTAKLGLLEYYHLVIEVAQETSTIPKNLYFFAEEMFDNLGCEDDIPYLIKSELRETIPGTYEMCSDSARQSLLNFSDAYRYLSNMRLHIICLSPTIIDNPLDWVLIAHEIGHILEKETWEIVYPRYPQIRPYGYKSKTAAKVRNPAPIKDKKEPKWALEMACDLVATIAFGPIYGFRLIENFFKEKEEEESSSHPFWKYRLKYIAEELAVLGWKEEAATIKNKIQDVLLPGTFDQEFVPDHWEAIRADILKKFQDKALEYRHTVERAEIIASITEKLNDHKPCITIKGKTVSPFDILNAAEKVKDELKLDFDFKEFLADMIRLAATKRIYDKKRTPIKGKSQGKYHGQVKPRPSRIFRDEDVQILSRISMEMEENSQKVREKYFKKS
jgi:hypothetical protein